MKIYDNPEYWLGELGYRKPGYMDFIENTLKDISILTRINLSMLDIGCAYGYSVGRMRILGFQAWGIDVSSLAISRANKRARPYLILGSVENLPFADKSIDFCFSSGVLEHVDDVQKAANEIQRVCNHGLIGVACLDDSTTHEGDDVSHQTLLTRADWQKLFNDNFEVISDSSISWRKYATFKVHELRYKMEELCKQLGVH